MTRLDGTSFPPADSPEVEIEGSWAPTRRASVASVEVDSEGVLLDEATGSRQLLDPLATVIWSLLDGSTTLDGLVGDLSDVFATDADQVRSDVSDLVRHLRERGLLQSADGAEPTDGGSHVAPPADAGADAGQPRFLERPGST